MEKGPSQDEPGPRASHMGVHHLLGRLPKGHVVFLLRDKREVSGELTSSPEDRPGLVVEVH